MPRVTRVHLYLGSVLCCAPPQKGREVQLGVFLRIIFIRAGVTYREVHTSHLFVYEQNFLPPPEVRNHTFSCSELWSRELRKRLGC